MCDTPFYKRIDGILEELALPCGKCPPCKLRRVSDWVLRLEHEDKVSSSSHFITLTYDTTTIPISENGFMSLCKKDYQDFMKRLRHLTDSTLKYYACGEYGEKNWRPHYHAILFNLDDPRKVNEAWDKGQVHVGTVTSGSIAYTCKYIDKQKRIPAHKMDDRVPEFSLMSKGLGKSYLKPSNIAWHKAKLDRNYVIKEGGYKVALPKYYRDKIFDDEEKRLQRRQIRKLELEKKEALAEDLKRKFGDRIDVDTALHSQKIARKNKFYSQTKNVRK